MTRSLLELRDHTRRLGRLHAFGFRARPTCACQVGKLVIATSFGESGHRPAKSLSMKAIMVMRG